MGQTHMANRWGAKWAERPSSISLVDKLPGGLSTKVSVQQVCLLICNSMFYLFSSGKLSSINFCSITLPLCLELDNVYAINIPWMHKCFFHFFCSPLQKINYTYIDYASCLPVWSHFYTLFNIFVFFHFVFVIPQACPVPILLAVFSALFTFILGASKVLFISAVTSFSCKVLPRFYERYSFSVWCIIIPEPFQLPLSKLIVIFKKNIYIQAYLSELFLFWEMICFLMYFSYFF